jgi:LacI family transcriptional regulator
MNIRSNRNHVTIKDVAEKAGVSQMTVSRVVNGQSLVKAKTRQKVEAAIGALGYRPNLMARRLAGGNSFFIGIVYHNPSPSYLAKVLEGALKACRAFGHHLVIDDLGTNNPHHGSPEKVAESLYRAGLDGVIITPPLSDNRELVDALSKLGVASVRVAPGNVLTQSLRVAMDDTEAVRQMSLYLISQGHARIGFIKAPKGHPSSALRYEGYVTALREAGIKLYPEHVVDGAFTYRSGMEGGFELLDLKDRPTAIFASNDDMAAGVIASAAMRGLSVPADLSVAGFDDTEIATSIWPSLTTIRQPIAEMAEQAVNILCAELTGDESFKDKNTELLKFQLIKRSSVQPPKP